MAENAPLFGNTGLPKNTTPLSNRRVTNALVGTTVGAAPGVATSVSRARVAHTNANTGKVRIETVSDINRNSNAGDVTALKTRFTRKKPSFAFPRDKSGNGGPAFTRA